MNKRLPFYALWLIFPLLAVFVVTKSAYFFGLSTPAMVVNFLLRVIGLAALPLLAWQIFLGAYMEKMASRFGGWVAKYHFQQGIIIGTLIFMHPVMLFVERYLSLHILDPFYVFTDVCLLCQNKRDLFLTAGRFGFWLIVMGIIAGKIREWEWWKENWRYFHWLNYLGFLVIFFHGFKLGTDFHSPFYLPVAYFSLGLVLISVIKRLLGR